MSTSILTSQKAQEMAQRLVKKVALQPPEAANLGMKTASAVATASVLLDRVFNCETLEQIIGSETKKNEQESKNHENSEEIKLQEFNLPAEEVNDESSAAWQVRAQEHVNHFKMFVHEARLRDSHGRGLRTGVLNEAPTTTTSATLGEGMSARGNQAIVSVPPQEISFPLPATEINTDYLYLPQ